MGQALADFMLHIQDDLYPGERIVLEEGVRANGCVVSAHIPARLPHLMWVVYDSECAHARDILGQVRSLGVRASLL